MVHWLDDIIAMIRREAQRVAGGSPDQAAQHDTAAAILERVRDNGASHDEVRAHLSAAVPRLDDNNPSEPSTGDAPEPSSDPQAPERDPSTANSSAGAN